MGIAFYIRRKEMVDNCGWSYPGFHRFRVRLAKEIGIDLDKMIGFTQHQPADGLPWMSMDDEPLVLLLDHSDCDGEMSGEDCELVAPALA